MQATQTTASALSYPAVRTNRRVVTASAIVIALHAALIAVVLMKRDAVTPVALESQTITAELIKPEPVAAPAAIQSTPTPPPPKPVPVKREKPKVQPKPKPTPTPPLPVADAPSQHVVETSAPSQPAPPAPTPPAPAAQAAPAVGKPTMALTAPKNVSHLECNIVKPDYPTLSRRRGETGTAYVHFVVGLTGKIENIELKKSSGYSRLDDAAMGAMRDSSCKPYLEDGQPVRAAYTQPFGFTLDD